MMKCCSKEQIDRSGTTKSPKTGIDFSHVCPSKLSKRELEELYFGLLQNNMEMKKNFNKQNEQLKVLSTKLQRMMSTQRTYMANEPKDCCSATKAVVQDQKKTIAELKKANDQLKNEVKNLNMKLCSTRQFLKRSSLGPYQMQNKATSRPTSSIIGRSDSTRNSSTSALNTKKPEAADNMQMKSVSCQCLDKLGLPGDFVKLCDENKCRTQMDELKQKIVNLQEELNKTHEEYANRISKLEQEVTDLQEENVRVRKERTARDLSLDRRNLQVKEIKKKLRETRCECEVLNTELVIEKGKVAELEAQVKATEIGAPLIQAIEQRLAKDTPAEHANKLKDDASQPEQKEVKDGSKKTDNVKPEEEGSRHRIYSVHKCSAADPDDIHIFKRAGTKKIKNCCMPSEVNEPSSSKRKQDESTNDPNVEEPEKQLNMPTETKTVKDCCKPSEINDNELSSSKRTQDESTSSPVEKPERKLNVPTVLDFIPEVPEQQQTGAMPTQEDLTPQAKEVTSKVYHRDSEMPLGVPIASGSESENKENTSEIKGNQSGESQLKEKSHENGAQCDAEKKKHKELAENLNALGAPIYWSSSSNDKMAAELRLSTEISPTKKSDDSGYAEANRSGISNDNEKGSLQKLNNELTDKIADLQKQLDDLKARMLSNSDMYTVDSDGMLKAPSDSSSTSEYRRNHKSKRAKKQKDIDGLKDVNQRWHNYDEPSNDKPTYETSCCQKQNDKGNKDNDNKYQIPGPIPVTSTPLKDGSASHVSVLSELKDSIVISKEHLIKNRKASMDPKPTQFRPRSQSVHHQHLRPSLVKSQEDQKTIFYTDLERRENQPASIPENETQTVNKSPSDISGQQTKEAPTMLIDPNVGENQTSDQKTAPYNQKSPQQQQTKPQDTTTVPLAKKPSHIQEIIHNLYARFAKETPKSSQAQTEGPNSGGQNIEELPTTSKNPEVVGSPLKAQTEVGPHKCICSQDASDSNAQNTTPKQADSSSAKCCENPTTPGETPSNVAKNPVPLPDSPVNVIKKNASPVTFSKDAKSRPLDDYLNNQNSNFDIENNVVNRDGLQDQGNQSIGKSSVGTEVPEKLSFDNGRSNGTEVPVEPPPTPVASEQLEPIMYMPPMRPSATSNPFIIQKPKDDYTQLSNEDKAIDSQLDICEHLTHVCTCPHEPPARRDVSVFRTCSGTLRFRTTNAASRIRRCGCSKGKRETANCGSTLAQYVNSETQSRKVRNDEGVQANDRRNVDTSAPKTYTINAQAELVKCSRATSPENTDQEISSMTDLPSEKDTSSSPRCNKCGQSSSWTSPGQDKATTTSSRSATTPTAYCLSEGELPNLDHSNLSELRERGDSILPAKSPGKRNLMENSSSAQMEAALQAISLELERCRHLLLQTRTPEETPMSSPSKAVKDASAMAEPASPPSPLQQPTPPPPPPGLHPELLQAQSSTISLRKTEARPRIGDAYTPRAMFTLHIGTVVLSDEAVINSRDLSLVLTWQFYDQNVAMSRMRSGRVVHFDFSTEYDLKLTDEFLDYLKADELLIKICEVNKLDEPLASSSLPLREALLHTNRRVDMSLALLAGPNMRWSPPTADALDSGDEMGVLDLWCMLRAEPRLLPRINKAIAQTQARTSSQISQSNRQPTNAIMNQINEDDQDDIRISGELTGPNLNSLRNSDSPMAWSMDRGVQTRPAELNIVRNDRRNNRYGYRDSAAPFPPYPSTAALATPHRLSVDNESMEIKHPLNSMDNLKNQVSFENRWSAVESRRRNSGIIINEVPANVKTTLQMKEALEKNNRQSFIDDYEGDNKRDSQGQISIKSLASRRPKKLSLDKRDLLSMATRANANSLDDLLNNTNYDDKNIIKRSEMEPTRDRHNSDTTELSKKYDNMSKMIGAKKAMEAFKRVKIKKLETPVPVSQQENYDKPTEYLDRIQSQSIDITILWLALNEECAAMGDPGVQRLYVAYTFIGHGGADLETPLSLPKPKQSQDKCYFNFKKSFQLTDSDLPILGRMARCRSPTKGPPDTSECIVFTVVSEPVEDPLGLNNCEDIGNAHLFFGDLLAYSAGSDTYTEVIPVRAAHADESVCGVLAIRVDGLDVVRKCLMISSVSDQHQPGVSF